MNRNPTQLLQGKNAEIAEHRNVHCGMYGLCLNKAVREGWNDWTCRRCESFVATANKPSASAYATARRYDAVE